MSGSADPAAPHAGAPAGRLKKRRDFLRAASRGKRAARPGLVLQAVAGEPGRLRLGFTVTRKVGNAVVRNRARRRLKEAARLTLPGLGAEGWDFATVPAAAVGAAATEDSLRIAGTALAG